MNTSQSISYKVEYISDSATNVNEDLIGNFENFYWVMDGATPLSEVRHFTGLSDANWFVQELSNSLVAVLSRSDDSELKSILNKAIDRVREKLLDLKINIDDVPSYELPSCGIVLIKVNKSNIEYLILGDPILAFYSSEETEIIQDTTISKLDSNVIDLIKELNARDVNQNEIEKQKVTLLRRNRSLMNSEHGYWVCTLDKKGTEDAIVGELPLCKGNRVIACTDGFARVVDLFNSFDWQEVFSEELDLQFAIEELRSKEELDKECERFGRLKVSDDASILRLTF